MTDPVRFAIVGAGWRAGFFLRVARELPDRFALTGLLSRDAAKADRLGRQWVVPQRASLDDLLADEPAFVVVVVPWAATPGLLREVTERGVPCLSETPPAPDVDGLLALRQLADAGARIQVAEQYQFQPLHAARLAISRSGRLGTVSQVQVSVAHGYHGINLIRRMLAVTFDPVTITARRFTSPLVAGPDRSGPPASERIAPSEQLIATFDFGERLGILDYTEDQYFSWIRSPRLLVRGERGEINGTTLRYMVDATTPATMELVRHDAGQDGNLEGLYHKGITCGEEWVYRNPFVPARLADDEIAVATCLARMAEYVEGGPDFCSLADAVHDHHLGILADEAAASGKPRHLAGHLWSS